MVLSRCRLTSAYSPAADRQCLLVMCRRARVGSGRQVPHALRHAAPPEAQRSVLHAGHPNCRQAGRNETAERASAATPPKMPLSRASGGGGNMNIEHTLQSGGPETAYSTCARWQRHRRQPPVRSLGHGRAQRGSDRCMRRALGRAECRTARRPGGSGAGRASAAGTAGIGSGGGGCCPGAFRAAGHIHRDLEFVMLNKVKTETVEQCGRVQARRVVVVVLSIENARKWNAERFDRFANPARGGYVVACFCPHPATQTGVACLGECTPSS